MNKTTNKHQLLTPIPNTENRDFVPPKDPPTGQPNMEGFIPITMAIAWIASTSPSLVVLWSASSPPRLSNLPRRPPPASKHGFAWWTEQASAHTSIPNLLSSSIPESPSVSLWAKQISARGAQSSSVALFCRRPRCPSEVKPRPWAWQSTPPISNRTTP
jgi:hypothetical protein